MSIQGKVNELNSIKSELKSLRARGTMLRKKMKDVEEEIKEYLERKDQPGLKYRGTAIIRETVTKRAPKKKQDATNDAVYVLEKHGIHSPERVLKEVMDARRYSPTEHDRLRFKK